MTWQKVEWQNFFPKSFRRGKSKKINIHLFKNMEILLDIFSRF